MIRQLFKRSTVFFIGSLASQALTTLVWIIIARLFLPSQVGNFILFINILLIVTFLADFGLNQWYQKEVGRGQSRKETFQRTFAARMTTLSISFAGLTLFLIYKPLFNFQISFLLLILLVIEAFIFMSDGYYLEQKKGHYVALKKTVGSIPLVILLLLLRVYGSSQSTQLFLSFFIAELVTMLWFFPWKEIVSFNLTYFKRVKETLLSSYHYALLIVSSFAYARGDAIIIGFTAGNNALGLYSLAYKYLEALSLFPTAISQNLFHISAKKGGTTLSQLVKMTLLMCVLGLVLGTALFLFSRILIVNILGVNYIDAIPLLQIFSFVVVLFFTNAPLATVVQSSDLVRRFLPWGILNTILNLALNIYFIPINGVIAAAWIMVFTEATGFLINVYFSRKVYRS